MRYTLLLSACLLGAVASTAQGEVTKLDSLRHQAATVLADVDFARRHCTGLRIDAARLRRVVARAQMSEVDLRASDDYRRQADALAGMHRQYAAEMVCGALPGRASQDVIQ